MTEPDLCWCVERVCFNAFPSLKQVILRGWLLRFSKGVSRRGNSANPVSADCAPLDGLIEPIETLYRRQQQPAIFRVPSFLAAALDPPLVARGYTSEGETSVLYGAMDGVTAASDPSVELLPEPTPEWLAAMATLQGHTDAQREVYRRIVETIAVSVAFAGLRIDGHFAALAYGAVSDGLLVYESVITDAARRREGLASRVIASLAAWGREEGARGACLQVEASNTPARALYARFGLTTELYRYRYWREPKAAG